MFSSLYFFYFFSACYYGPYHGNTVCLFNFNEFQQHCFAHQEQILRKWTKNVRSLPLLFTYFQFSNCLGDFFRCFPCSSAININSGAIKSENWANFIAITNIFRVASNKSRTANNTKFNKPIVKGSLTQFRCIRFWFTLEWLCLPAQKYTTTRFCESFSIIKIVVIGFCLFWEIFWKRNDWNFAARQANG